MVGEPLGPREALGVDSGGADGVVGDDVPAGVADGTAVGVGLQPTAMTRTRASTTVAGRRGRPVTGPSFTPAR